MQLIPLLAITAAKGLAALPFLVAGCKPGPVEPLTLTAENTRVVIAPDAGTVVRFAADEMTNFLAQVLGGPVPIGTDLESKSRVAIERSEIAERSVGLREDRMVNIVLGTNKWSVAAGLNPEKLPRDSFIHSSTSTSNFDSFFISGCDDPSWDIRGAWNRGECGETTMNPERATLFGVYDFLERYAGCRFYFYGPLGTIVPKKASLTIPVGTRTETPAFAKRMWYSVNGKLMDGDEIADHRGSRQQGFIQHLRQRRFSGTPMVHGVRHMQLRERFGKTHPEYFWASREKDGKLHRHSDSKDGEYTHLCWTSGVLDEIFKDAEAYSKGLPPESRGFVGCKGKWPLLMFWDGILNLIPDDGFLGCECDTCRAAYTSTDRSIPSSYCSRLVWTKTGEMAKRLKAAGIPLSVEQHAYTYLEQHPDGLTLPDNVIVGVSQLGPWAEGTPKRQMEDLEEIKTWSKAAGGAKVFQHNWSCKYGKTNIPDLPCWTPRAFGAYYERVAPYSKGVYNESLSDRYVHVVLNNYIIGKMTWDPKFDWRAAIEEFYQLMFGPAAPEMKAFFEEVEDIWIGKIAAGKLEYNALGPVLLVPSKFEIWRSIYTEEKLAKWERLFDAAEKKVNKSKSKVEVEERTGKFHSSTWTSNFDSNLYARRLALMKRNVLDPVVAARKKFAEDTDPAREEARRKREGVKNLLSEAVSVDYTYTDDEARAKKNKATGRKIPFVFEPNSTYRLSFFLDTEDVKPLSGYKFCGALVAVWRKNPGAYFFSAGNGAVTGSTAGRVHQSMILETGKAFGLSDIEVQLRGATGHMKVDGLILEKIK